MEMMPCGAFGKESLSFCLIAHGRVACDLTFDECAICAANSGRFARTVNVGNAGGLVGIDPDEAVLKFATERKREFDVWNEAEAAGEVIAVFGPGVLAVGESYAIDLLNSFGPDGPNSITIRDSGEPKLQLYSLPELRWVSREEQDEFPDACLRSLL